MSSCLASKEAALVTVPVFVLVGIRAAIFNQVFVFVDTEGPARGGVTPLILASVSWCLYTLSLRDREGVKRTGSTCANRPR